MLHIALYGRGRWGSAIKRTLDSMPDVSVTVVGRGSEAPSDIDGAIIATPISTHVELAMPFIREGIPVLIEKPLTDSFRAAKQLIATAKKSRSLVQVGHIHLHNPAFKKVQELVPTLGGIRYLYFEGTNNGPFRNDASVLWDWLPHPLSMAIQLLKSEPLQVQAWGFSFLHPRSQLYDLGIVKYDFPKSVALICSVNWLNPEKRTKMTIVGKHSSLVHTDTDQQKIALYENMGPGVKGTQVTHQVPSITHPSYAPGWPLEHELRAFLEAIQKKQRDRAELDLGAKIVTCIEAAQNSAKKGGKVVRFKV